MLLQKIIEELQNIPEEKRVEVYDLIHEKTATLTVNEGEARTPGLLTGKLSDAFFEPLPAEELQRWE